MNALSIVLIAACCSALANFFFRKSTVGSEKDNTNGYLLCFYVVTFAFSLIIYPSIWTAPWNFTVIGMGCFVGVFNVALMLLTSRALARGPAGLTFAFQNASAVFPGMLLFLIFGSEYNFTYSLAQLTGMVLVILGLFLGAKNNSGTKSPIGFRWMKYAVGCLCVQAVALTMIQGRCVLFDCHNPESALYTYKLNTADDAWFVPAQFGMATLLQTLIFIKNRPKIVPLEYLYGSLGGISNCASSCLLLVATKWALADEKAILFPLFAVGTMILCNFWALVFYKEKFNFQSSTACGLGILIGSFL